MAVVQRDEDPGNGNSEAAVRKKLMGRVELVRARLTCSKSIGLKERVMVGLSGTGIWSGGLRYGDASEAAEAGAELESLGYSALWIPDTGGDLFESLERLLSATTGITVASGILNLWMHTPEETAAAYARLTDVYGDRLLVGIGVSHAPLIDAAEPGRYRTPLASTARFLDGLDAADRPLPSDRRVLAALGPKMLELARQRTAGTHPYNVTPEHTAAAREAIGTDGLVLPEQAVALERDPSTARALGRAHLSFYFSLPNYVNNLRRLGFGDEDFTDGGSDRLVDALVAWGDEDAIRRRLDLHRAAGADHVCIQVLTDTAATGLPLAQWRALAPALVD
jgi:probable F420-dependent oxidoreductase